MSQSYVPYDVAVAGAGISGLTCAWALRKAGLRVVVLDAAHDVGGCISTVRRDGCIADGGPQTFNPTPSFLDVVSGVGLEGSLVQAKSGAPYLFSHGRLTKAPTSPPAFVASPLLSPLAKLRLLAEPLIGARSSQEDESVASFAARRGGRAVVDAIVGPMIGGIFAGDPSEISMRSAFPALVEYERTHTSVMLGSMAHRRRSGGGRRPKPVAFTGGNDALPLALAAALAPDVRFGARICDVTLRGANVELTFDELSADRYQDLTRHIERRPQAGDDSIVARHAVLALPAYASAELLNELEPDAADALRAIPYAPVAQVALTYERSDVRSALDGFGFLAGAASGLRILGCTWNSSMFDDRCPPERVLVTAFLGGTRDPDVVSLRDEEIVATAHRDLERAIGVSAPPRVIAGFRRDRAIPQLTMGHAKRLEQIAKGMSRLPQMTLAGNYFRGPSVPDCISGALAAAENVVKRLAARDAAVDFRAAPSA